MYWPTKAYRVLKIVTRSLAQCDLKVIWASWNKTVHAQFASYKFPILPPESVDFFTKDDSQVSETTLVDLQSTSF